MSTQAHGTAAIVDPDHGPDLDDLMQRVGIELELIMASP